MGVSKYCYIFCECSIIQLYSTEKNMSALVDPLINLTWLYLDQIKVGLES